MHSNSKFWTSTKNINEEKTPNYKKILVEEKAFKKELNSNIKIKFNSKPLTKFFSHSLDNNNDRVNFDGSLNKISKFKFSKIENLYQYEPTISFYRNNIIFFDNKGSILQFNDKSKLVWKKNYYTKKQKKLKPILQFANNDKYLIIADNIAKYYKIDLETGSLIWSKKNLAPFNSQIKIFEDKFFIVDFSNTLRCFSLKTGDELWNINTEKSLIRSKKKLSMVIVKGNIFFNNSIGDISAVNINKGELLWQLPTQSSSIYESAFSLETSDLITDKKSLFFSNNKNQIFSIDIDTGTFNWINKVNSNNRPTLVENYLFSISMEGYLIVLDKNSGNIIRITDIFNHFSEKKRSKIKPVGFILGSNKIYLSTNNGRLIIIDIFSGKMISKIKIDNEKILRPSVFNENLFIIKDNAIIKLN
jgi:outer membrane protein assembly factor BamB